MKPITTGNYPSLRTGRLVIDKKHQRQGYGKDIPDWCLKGPQNTIEGLDVDSWFLTLCLNQEDFVFDVI